MCFVKRVQEVRRCFYIGYDGMRDVNIFSIERREFILSRKVFLDMGHESLSNQQLVIFYFLGTLREGCNALRLNDASNSERASLQKRISAFITC